MATLHQKLAVVIVLAALGGTIWSGYLTYRARESQRLRQVGWVLVSVAAVQGAAGLLVTTSGGQPNQVWHYVFGPLSFLALPAALLAASARSGRVAASIVLAGWLLTFAIGLRAIGTGGLPG